MKRTKENSNYSENKQILVSRRNSAGKILVTPSTLETETGFVTSGSQEAMASKYDEMMKAKKYLPYKMGYLPEKIVQKAKDELNETDEVRGPCLDQLRKMVLAESKLKCPTTDEYLLQFLRARKFDVKKAFNLLQNKYKVKKEYSDVYDRFDWDRLTMLLKDGPMYALPYRDEDGCIWLILKIAHWNCSEYTIQEALKVMTAIMLCVVEDPMTQVTGVKILVDVKGVTFSQMRCLTPRYLHLFSKALRNCLPIRFKGIHIFNESTFFQYMWSVLKLFLSEKIKKRVYFHGDNQKNLHKNVSKALLPTEYGGDNAHFNASDWCKAEEPIFIPLIDEVMQCGYS